MKLLIALYKKVKWEIILIYRDLKRALVLPVFLKSCPKCKGAIKHYFRKACNEEQYYCPRCKIVFPASNFAKYKDCPEVAYERWKERVLKMRIE